MVAPSAEPYRELANFLLQLEAAGWLSPTLGARYKNLMYLTPKERAEDPLNPLSFNNLIFAALQYNQMKEVIDNRTQLDNFIKEQEKQAILAAEPKRGPEDDWEETAARTQQEAEASEKNTINTPPQEDLFKVLAGHHQELSSLQDRVLRHSKQNNKILQEKLTEQHGDFIKDLKSIRDDLKAANVDADIVMELDDTIKDAEERKQLNDEKKQANQAIYASIFAPQPIPPAKKAEDDVAATQSRAAIPPPPTPPPYEPMTLIKGFAQQSLVDELQIAKSLMRAQLSRRILENGLSRYQPADYRYKELQKAITQIDQKILNLNKEKNSVIVPMQKQQLQEIQAQKSVFSQIQTTIKAIVAQAAATREAPSTQPKPTPPVQPAEEPQAQLTSTPQLKPPHG
jgi:hypothetical protein